MRFCICELEKCDKGKSLPSVTLMCVGWFVRIIKDEERR
jgi:hypothetical protein